MFMTCQSAVATFSVSLLLCLFFLALVGLSVPLFSSSCCTAFGTVALWCEGSFSTWLLKLRCMSGFCCQDKVQKRVIQQHWPWPQCKGCGHCIKKGMAGKMLSKITQSRRQVS